MRRSRCGGCHSVYTPFASLTPESCSTLLTETSLLASLCGFLSIAPGSVNATALVTHQLTMPPAPVPTSKKRHSTSAPHTKRDERGRRLSAPIRSKQASPPAPTPAADPTRCVFLLAKTVRSFVRDEVLLSLFHSPSLMLNSSLQTTSSSL
jgi:hypothetical protein